MRATITTDYLNADDPEYSDEGVTFGDGVPGAVHKRFTAYDDDGICYYALTADLDDDCDLGDLLTSLAAYAGVTALHDVTHDGDDWSAS